MEPLAHGLRASLSRRDILRTAAAAPFALLPLLPGGCSPTQNQSAAPGGVPKVRVLVLENRPRVDLSGNEPPTLRVGEGPAERVALPQGSSAPVHFTGSGWKVGDHSFAPGELTIESATDGAVAIDGRAYRGKYRFIPRGSAGKIDVVNEVDVDGYLMGVVAREMFPNWHEEAYRAQAVVARTYSLFIARTNSQSSHYDLFADTRSQMYGGIAGESAKSRAAVEDTRGWVVAYGPRDEERIFKAYYSSCCGGVTQSASAAFGEPVFEPLSEQNIGPRCAIATRFSWPTVVVTRSEVTHRLRVWAANHNESPQTIGDVARIDILASNSFGRPTSFAVTDIRGNRFRLGCEDLRQGINTDASDGAKLYSSFCHPINEGSSIRFAEGHGFGHGVGMCQWCAQVQAGQGIGYQQIVREAFPGSVMVHVY